MALRKLALVIQASQVPGNLTDFPVLLARSNLDDEVVDPSGSNSAQTDGGDLKFYSDSDLTTRLPCEVVQFEHDTSTGAGDAVIQVWVEVPSVSGSVNTSIYMTYNETDSQPAVGDQYGRNAVWANGFAGVWHLEEDPSDGAPQFVDSTGNGNDGTSSNLEAGDQQSGQIGGSIVADGSDESITVGQDAALEPTSAVCVETWMLRNGSVANFATIVWNGPVNNDPWGAYGWQQGDNADDEEHFWKITTGSVDTTITVDGIAASTWYHLFGVYDGSDMTAYLDGSQAATAGKTGSIGDYGSPGLRFFGDSTGGFGNYSLDEIRIYDEAKTSDWIGACYNNQNSPSTFITEGTPGDVSGAVALLADDIESASELGTPAIGQAHGLLADDVESASELSAPAVGQVHGLLADDLESVSELGAPVLAQVHGLLADDVESASENTSPALAQVHALTQPGSESASEVTSPTIGQEHGLAANDAESESEVTAPDLTSAVNILLADDAESASEVTSPSIAQVHALLQSDVESLAEVSSPVVFDGTAQASTGGHFGGSSKRKIRRSDDFKKLVEDAVEEALAVEAPETVSIADEAPKLTKSKEKKVREYALRQALVANAANPEFTGKLDALQEQLDGLITQVLAGRRVDRRRKVALLKKRAELRSVELNRDEEEAIVTILMMMADG